jgi:hypothetical protein
MNNRDKNCDEVFEKEKNLLSENDDGLEKEDIINEDINLQNNYNDLLNKKRSNKPKKTKGN